MVSRIFLQALMLICVCAIAAVGGDDSGGGRRELWCVAKNNAEDAALQSSLDWACGPGGADCGPIQKGGPCYDASDLQRTASYAFNDYYLKHGSSEDACNFSNTAAVTSLNPSRRNCKFPSSLNSGTGSLGGSAMAGADDENLSSSDSTALHPLNWRIMTLHLFVAITFVVVSLGL